jgi:UDP-N-acetylglucosamine:LPS N-acetylglucosamine transferase
MRENLKVCLAASAGGHASQLMRLEQCWKGYPCFSITTSHAVKKHLARYGPVYVVDESNRQRPAKLLRALVSCIRIMRKERPGLVISTGAAAGCIACFVAKLAGARVIWVDSIANVERLSLSGRLIRPFADLVLTQWPDVAQKCKSVEYAGHIV